jgi:hypothetical protein
LPAAVSVAVVVAGVGAIVVLGTGNGYPAARPQLLSGAAWLASSQAGQLTLLDGSSAEVAAQVQVAGPGERLDVVQESATAYSVNSSTGTIRRVDGASFELTPPATPLPGARGGLRAFAGPDALYALDTQRGILTAADPVTLTDRGAPVPLATEISPQAAALDDAGRLWVLDTTTGDLVWIDNGQRHARRSMATPGAGLLVIANGAPVVVDQARRTAELLDPRDASARAILNLDLRPGDRLQVGGSPHSSRLYLVASRGVLDICDLTATTCGSALPLGGSDNGDLGAPVETGGRLFVPDYANGQVWIVDLQQAKVVAQPKILDPKTKFQLLTRDGVVFYNDPNSEHAGVLRLDGGVRPVAKYDPGDPGKGVIGQGSGEKARQPQDPTDAPDTPPPPGIPPAPAPANPTGGGAVRIVLSKPRAVVDEDIAMQAQITGGQRAVRIAWTFGDGQSATGLSTVHRWRPAGTYQVSVNVRFADGQTAATSLPIQITTVPPATATLTVQVTGKGTVTSQPPGISCPPTCSAPFLTSDTVKLTPTPAPGQQFVTWAGDCAGGAACAVVMSRDRQVFASFNQAPVTVTATVSAIKGSYTGACPPPKNATTYQAVITVSSGPVTVTYRWTSSNGGDSDPSTKTVTFSGTGRQSQTVTHNESFYLPGQTVNDWIAVDLLTPTNTQSNHAAYQLTCT